MKPINIYEFEINKEIHLVAAYSEKQAYYLAKNEIWFQPFKAGLLQKLEINGTGPTWEREVEERKYKEEEEVDMNYLSKHGKQISADDLSFDEIQAKIDHYFSKLGN